MVVGTVWWVAVVLVVVVSGVERNNVRIDFINAHNKLVTVYWERYWSLRDVVGLQRMMDVEPGQKNPVDTLKGDVFEVHESATMKFLALVQATGVNQDFFIDAVRQCGLYDDVRGDAESLFPLTTDIDVWRDMEHFSKVVMRLYHSKMYVYPTPEITRQRNINEQRRLYLNRDQPGMHAKFTKLGYEIRQLPNTLFQRLRDFWNGNRHKMSLEEWDSNNHHVNHWEAPSYTLWLPDDIQNDLRDTMRPMLEEWVNQPLEYTALYGIRVYTNNTYLLNHVDRSATHAVSAIIQVDQRVDEDWMLEVVGHDRRSNYLVLRPGEIALYESATVIHGRETKLKGDYFANVFIHFRPTINWNSKHI